MRRFTLASLLLLAGTAPAVPLSAAEVPGPAEVPAVTPEKVERAQARGVRSLSAETAAKLSAALPKFEPPAVAPPPGTPGTADPLSPHELDKPRNQIIRLPQLVVGEPKIHVPTRELEVLTPKGRADLAVERRPGLRFGPFAWLNRGIALAMLEDDLAAERRAQAVDLMSLYRIHDTVATDVARPKEP